MMQENVLRYIAIFFTVLRYIPFLIFSIKSNLFLNIRLNFEPYVIESEVIYTRLYEDLL